MTKFILPGIKLLSLLLHGVSHSKVSDLKARVD